MYRVVDIELWLSCFYRHSSGNASLPYYAISRFFFHHSLALLDYRYGCEHICCHHGHLSFLFPPSEKPQLKKLMVSLSSQLLQWLYIEQLISCPMTGWKTFNRCHCDQGITDWDQYVTKFQRLSSDSRSRIPQSRLWCSSKSLIEAPSKVST